LRQGQAEAILVAYDVMEVDGQDVRPEPLEERRKRLAKLLSRKTKTMRDGIQLSEAITGDGAAIFRHACWMDLEGIVSKRIGSRYVSGRMRAWLNTKNPDFERAQSLSPEPAVRATNSANAAFGALSARSTRPNVLMAFDPRAVRVLKMVASQKSAITLARGGMVRAG
jgi:hypothetical protein